MVVHLRLLEGASLLQPYLHPSEGAGPMGPPLQISLLLLGSRALWNYESTLTEG